jgi:hypothetical protein
MCKLNIMFDEEADNGIPGARRLDFCTVSVGCTPSTAFSKRASPPGPSVRQSGETPDKTNF